METPIISKGSQIGILHTTLGINKAINSLEVNEDVITQFRSTNWKLFSEKRIESFLLLSNETDLIGTLVVITDFTIEDDIKVRIKFYETDLVLDKTLKE